MNKKYVLNTQLSPELHQGEMKFYWRIELHTADGVFNVRDGWNQSFDGAIGNAHSHAREFI
jgi:hypothetical protein